MSIDMSQFYQVFFEETSEHLANMENLLLDLDLDQPSLDDLNAIFRAAHSIKGGSGTFGFTDMTEVTHVLEGLLDRLRRQELPLRAEMIDAFLAAGDVLRGQLAHHQGGPAVAEEDVRAICTRLARLAAGDAATAAADGSTPGPQGAQTWHLVCLLPPDLAASDADIDHLLAALREIAAVDLRHRPDAANGLLEARLTTAHGEAGIRDILAYYVGPEDIALAPAEGSLPADAAYGFFDAPAAVAVDVASQAGDTGFGLFTDAPGCPPAAAADTPAAIEGEGYGLFTDAPGSPPAASSPAAPASPAGRRLADNPSVELARSGRRETDKTVITAGADSSIRVSVEKVDQLINLVGELVITQAMLAQTAAHLDPVQAEKLLAGIELLSRNTRDLQEAVMSIRMLPMSMVFSRFPRVVRDLAGKLGKQVEMRTVGENTELDKGLIEKIIDPLTHLVRNSLDHGIETPEKRVAAGKSPQGTLTLKACHQAGAVVIEVMDDGAGLNRARILEKACERGLAVDDAMSDHEVWQLIFAPGFSTAEEVTDVSGRGVGMDVVKRNIEGLGGRVELDSSPGFCTRTVIRLPLTLAILDGMSVGVGGETFIVPIISVVESLQARTEDIRTLAGEARMLHIRGEYLPLIALAEVFALPGRAEISQGLVLVVEGEEGKAALLVDELLGQQQVVIKSLEANYRKVAGISGATILGDGRVALILDVAAVIRLGLRGQVSGVRSET